MNKPNILSLRLFVIGASSFCLAALLAWLASFDEVFGLFGFQLIGSFGASIAIVTAMPESNSSRVKNIVLGSLLSVVIGILITQYLDTLLWLKVAAAISLSIMLMIASDTFHPPGGAIALITVVSGEQLTRVDSGTLFLTVLMGAILIAAFSTTYRYFFQIDLMIRNLTV